MYVSKTCLKRDSVRAFTLIEVIAASAVMVVLVGIVAFITSSIMSTWNRASGKLVANAEARLALDMIAQDLETAFLSNNGQQWLRVEQATFTDTTAPYTAAQSDSTILKLFAPAVDRDNGDGICAIAYKLEYQPTYSSGSSTSSAPITYGLYRMVEDPVVTLRDYLSSRYDDPDTSAQGTLIGNGVAPADWSNSKITNVNNYLASNIVSFKVIIYDDSQTLPKNADANNSITRSYAYGGKAEAGVVFTNDLLYADIILTVVTDEGAEMLTTRNIDGSAKRVIDLIPETAAEVVTQNGETLIRRVYFKSSPI